MASWVWIIIAVVIVAVLAAAAGAAARRRRSATLQRRFGPEYDRAVESRQDRRVAEAELREREKFRAGLDIRPLPEEQRVRFAGAWRAVQEQFVDQPAAAVVAADRLVYEVMEARGYPMAQFAARADLISVDHPRVVGDYRFAHGVRERAEAGEAGTEELREALVRYRALFTELLQDGRTDGGAAADVPAYADGADGRIADAESSPDGVTAPAADRRPVDEPAAGVRDERR
jgi:hypothetical protein